MRLIHLLRTPRPIMEQRWSLTRMTNATLRVASSPKQERRQMQTSVLSQSWSCSYVASSDTAPGVLNDFGPMLDMERELYGGSNESLAEKVFSVEEISSQDSSSVAPSLDDPEADDFVLADLTTEDEDSNEDEAPSPPRELPQKEETPSLASGNLPPMKPPNVLIYTGVSEPAEDFARAKHRLQKCLDPDAYLVYFLAPDQLSRDPWMENTALLVLYCQELDPAARQHALQFCRTGGHCLNFFWGAASSLLGDLQDAAGVSWQFVELSSVHALLRPHLPRVVDATFPQPASGRLLIYQQDLLDGETDYAPAQERRLEVLRLMLARKLSLQCAKRPQESRLTSGYLLHGSPGERQTFLSALGNRRELPSTAVTLELYDEEPSSTLATASRLPVCLGAFPLDLPFNHSLYLEHLRTRSLGRTLLYCPVATTSMDLINGLAEFPGAVVIASRQTQGKGRGGNAWLSPEGCAMFTLNLAVPLHSNLGHHLPFLQHLVSVAMVHSIRSVYQLKDVDLRLKWPNDIYWGRRSKLGGLVVKTTLLHDTFHCHVGCGLNVSNTSPTQCLRDVLADSGVAMGVEEYIGRTLTQLELLLDSYQERGAEDLCLPLYYKYWLHSGQKVTLAESGQEAHIQGIDDYGFLLVKSQSGQSLSLQPDGNSFDLLKNLITIKAH